MSLASIALAAACLEAMEEGAEINKGNGLRSCDVIGNEWSNSKECQSIAQASPNAENVWGTCHTQYPPGGSSVKGNHIDGGEPEVVLNPSPGIITIDSPVPQSIPKNNNKFVRLVSIESDDGVELQRQSPDLTNSSCPVVSPIVSPGSVISETSDEEIKICPSRPSSLSAPVADGIAVNDNDVLCGRGGETNHHPGNVRYRALVKEMQHKYLLAKRRDKPQIARKIVDVVRERNGRFLKRCPNRGEWREIGQNKAREKTSQALREGAPEIREIYGNNAGCVGVSAKKDQAFPTPKDSLLAQATNQNSLLIVPPSVAGNNSGLKPNEKIPTKHADPPVFSLPTVQQTMPRQQHYLAPRSSSARSVTSSSSSSEDEDRSMQIDYEAARVVLEMHRNGGGYNSSKQCPQVPEMKSKKRGRNSHVVNRRNTLPAKLDIKGEGDRSIFPKHYRRASDPCSQQIILDFASKDNVVNTSQTPRGPRTKFFKARFNALSTSDIKNNLAIGNISCEKK